MPHIIVKLYAGRSEQQKKTLAQEISRAVMGALECGEGAVSVAVEDITPEDWKEKVYKPDILGNPTKIYKKPGYNPFEK
jgi:4-oxalocrotonate tautomerase